MNWNQLWKSGLATIALAVCVSAHAASNGVLVTLATDKQSLGHSDDVVVNVTFTNTASTPQYVLKYHTPFGGEIEESLFSITRDGMPVYYLGPHYKRPAPTAADYFLLKPGASHSVRVELSSLYDLSITGDYQISYNTKSMSLFKNELSGKSGHTFELGELTSAPLTIWIDGVQPRGPLAQEPLTLAKMGQPGGNAGLAYNRCTASQQSEIVTAVNTALSYATNADAYMQNGAIGSRYVKWFGANDAGRVATVKSHFVAIKDAFATKPITVDCGCKKTYYAYVYPTQPYTIYVCKAFWSAPMTGTDSKGGTLIHEMSHFNVVASTDDWVYGQSGAASLAISDPSKAIDNADSHEYFGENTPALQ